jgi:hypothetical protein
MDPQQFSWYPQISRPHPSTSPASRQMRLNSSLLFAIMAPTGLSSITRSLEKPQPVNSWAGDVFRAALSMDFCHLARISWLCSNVRSGFPPLFCHVFALRLSMTGKTQITLFIYI